MFMRVDQMKPVHMIFQALVRQWFQQPQEFSAEKNQQMECQFNACLNAQRDYF
jgi:hypothetical protein